MSLVSMPRLLISESDGWREISLLHPSVTRLAFYYVAPMSLIPAAMYAYSELIYPGTVFPLLEPVLSLHELAIVGGVFFAAEIVMVYLMAGLIQRVAESIDIVVSYQRTFTLAAIAPTPLWLASLVLFVPSVWAGTLVVAIAWMGTVALIRNGIRPLIGLEDKLVAGWMVTIVTVIGVAAWLALMIILVLVLSVVIGLR